MVKKFIIPLLLLVLLGTVSAIVAKPDVVSVFQSAAGKDGRKLPIYCVETDDKKVSISFDAAWGDS